MLSYSLKFRKNTETINPRVSKTNNGITMLLSKYALGSSKKSRFIKEQESSGLLNTSGIKIPMSKIPLLCKILF